MHGDELTNARLRCACHKRDAADDPDRSSAPAVAGQVFAVNDLFGNHSQRIVEDGREHERFDS